MSSSLTKSISPSASNTTYCTSLNSWSGSFPLFTLSCCCCCCCSYWFASSCCSCSCCNFSISWGQQPLMFLLQQQFSAFINVITRIWQTLDYTYWQFVCITVHGCCFRPAICEIHKTNISIFTSHICDLYVQNTFHHISGSELSTMWRLHIT